MYSYIKFLYQGGWRLLITISTRRKKFDCWMILLLKY